MLLNVLFKGSSLERASHIIIPIMLIILTILLSIHNYCTILLINPDEGIALYGAKRILLGQTLYKDFFDIVTPGTDYLLAGVFKVFGTTLKVARITTIIINALNVAMLYLVSISFIKNKLPAIIPTLFLMMIYVTSIQYYAVSHHWFMITAAFFTLVLSLKSEINKSNWIFPGMGTFLVFIFMQSEGLMLYSMLLFFFFIKVLLDNHNRGQLIHDLIYYSLGFWIPLVVVFLLFLSNGGGKAFIYDIFFWPWQHYNVINNGSHFLNPIDELRFHVLGYPFVQSVAMFAIWYLPPILIIASTILLVQDYLKYKTMDYQSLLLLLFVSAFIVNELFIISPFIYRFVIYWPFFFIIIIKLWKRGNDLSNRLFRYAGLIYIIGSLIFSGYFCERNYSYSNFIGKHSINIHSPAGNILVINNSPGIVSLVLVLLNDVHWKFPNNIFIFYWSPILYFISGSNNPTMLNTYIPLYNTKNQINTVIRQLALSKPQLIIKDGYLAALKLLPRHYANQNVFDPENDRILQYVNKHYVITNEIYGAYSIYKLKNK